MPEPLPISGHSRFDRRCSSRVYVLVPQDLKGAILRHIASGFVQSNLVFSGIPIWLEGSV